MRKTSAALIALACMNLVLGNTPARADWREASSTHFVVYGDESESTIRTFAENLERYHSALSVMTRWQEADPSPSNRVTIYSVGSLERVRKLFGDKEAGRYVAGFYIPRAGATLAIVPDITSERMSDWDLPLRSLFHEYAHHFLIGSGSYALPRWANEGAADFFAAVAFDKDGSVSIGRPNPTRLIEKNFVRDVSIGELLTDSDAAAKKGKGFNGFYAESWMLYHYLTLGDERKGQIQTYFKAVMAGKSSADAAREAFGDLARLDHEIDAYSRRTKFMTVRIRKEALKSGGVQIRLLSPGEAASMPLRIRQRRGVDKEQAAQIAPAMQVLAAKFPGDAVVQAALAEAEHDTGNFEASVAAADAALAIDAKLVNAHVQKCLSLFALADKAQDPKAFAKARAALVALNAVENDHPLPLSLYFASFARQGKAPTPVAIKGLERAVELAPYDQGLRMTLAMQQLRDGRSADASRNLMPVAYDPHGGKLADLARSYLDRIKANPAWRGQQLGIDPVELGE